jgi:hypothetical protein
MALRASADRVWRETKRYLQGCTLLLVLVCGAAPPLSAQVPPPASVFAGRMGEVAQILANEPRFGRLTPRQRQGLSEFVIGNMLFAMAHEMGHVAMGEMDIPVLGREEDAADSFAILNALTLGHDFAHRVLVAAAKGWFLSDQLDKKEGSQPTYYDEHGLNLQRAYQIVCLMVGSNPSMFKELADETKLPQDRRSSCREDYRVTAWSWETLLKPHLRATDQPRQSIEVVYGDAKGTLEVYVRMFRTIQFLELVGGHASERFAWPRPFLIEMRSCGEAQARWIGKTSKLELCYELAHEFAELYRVYGNSRRAKPKHKR